MPNLQLSGHVYFFQPEGGGPVKLGWSNMPRTRLAAYQNWCFVPLTMLAAIPSQMAGERMVHARFADERMHHEWFRASPRLMDFIDRARRLGAFDFNARDLTAYWVREVHYNERRPNLGPLLEKSGLTLDQLAAYLAHPISTVKRWTNQHVPLMFADRVLDFFDSHGVVLGPTDLIGEPREKRGMYRPRKKQEAA